MKPSSLMDDYYVNEADLEGSLDLMVLARLEPESRFYQRHENLNGLNPNPHFSERLYNFVQTKNMAVWVVGLGDGGEEMPVAIGIAERCANNGRGPVLLAGPEEVRPQGMGASGLRPIESGNFEPVLSSIFPNGCGAQTSGIQGVFRIWPGNDQMVSAIEPAGLVLASHWPPDSFWPAPDLVTGVVLVVPFRDQSAKEIEERVNQLRSSGYPMLGMVTIDASMLDHNEVAERKSSETPDGTLFSVPGSATEGGIMEGETTAKDQSPADDNQALSLDLLAKKDQTVPEISVVDDTAQNSSPTESSKTSDQVDSRGVADQTAETDEKEKQPPPPTSPPAVPPVAAAPTKRSKPANKDNRGNRPAWWLILLLIGVIAISIVITIRMKAFVPSDEPETIAEIEGRETGLQTEALLGGESDHPLPESDGESPVVDTDPVANATASGTNIEPNVSANMTDGSALSGDEASEGGRSVPTPVTTAESKDSSTKPANDGSTEQIPKIIVDAGPPFAVLCGSFQNLSNAKREVSRLLELGEDARLISLQIPDKGLFHRVIIGRESDLAITSELANKLVGQKMIERGYLVGGNGLGTVIPAQIGDAESQK